MAWRMGPNGAEEYDDGATDANRRGRRATNAPMESAQIVLPATPLPSIPANEAMKIGQSIDQRPQQYVGIATSASTGADPFAGVPDSQPPLPTTTPAMTMGARPGDAGEAGMMQTVQQPTALPPVITEASRIYSAQVPVYEGVPGGGYRLTNETKPMTSQDPVVSGKTFKRVAPGTGEYGENKDLVMQDVQRKAPMSFDEAKAKGLIAPSTPGFSFRQVGRAPTGPNAGQGMTRDAERAGEMDATRGQRWGQNGSTTRSQGRASAIVDQIRATRAERDQSKIRSDEALRTPQIQTGTYVGQSWVPDGKGGGSVQTVDATTGKGANKPITPKHTADILKQAANLRTGDRLKAIAPNPEAADVLENLLRQQGVDVDALKGGAPKPEDGGQTTATAAAAKPKYAEGQIGMLNGVKHVFKGGKWIPA